MTDGGTRLAHPPFMKIMILNYLLEHDTLTGYEFIKFSRDIGIAASAGSVYPHLKSLENTGWLQFEEIGKRKVYSLTEKGRAQLSKMPLADVPEFLRHAFFRNMSLGSTIDWKNPSDLSKLLNNVNEIKDFLENYIRSLS